MILHIRESQTFKKICLALSISIGIQILYPLHSYALTGGPGQPEFSSFTPIGAEDVVNLSSGDMNYNIPLMDVGGYPINLAYSAGIGMDDEASWVGLGWNLSVGQIVRNVRGLPDDFNGDKMTYENHLKPNVTVGASFKFKPALFGYSPNIDTNFFSIGGKFGVAAIYNNYAGFHIKPSGGIQIELGKTVSVGASAESGPDGLTLSPYLSLHKESKIKDQENNKLEANLGISLNSRRGLSYLTMDVSKTRQLYSQEGEKIKKYKSALGSHISFADQLYTPSKRVGMSTTSFTVNAALGTEVFGAEGQGQITAYGTVTKVKDSERNKQVPAYGYNHTHEARATAILDFNREKDGVFSVNSTNLPLTNYTYDLYSIQGQGISGQYRPYRNQVGYLYDSYVRDGSASFSLGAEFGTGNAFHLGVDIEATLVNSQSGLWGVDNLMRRHLLHRGEYAPDYEVVHYKNVGGLSADKDFQSMFSRTGSYQPVRVAFNENGPKFNRKALSIFKQKNDALGNETDIHVSSKINRNQRQLRNQTITHLTREDLDRGIGYGPYVIRNDAPQHQLPNYVEPHHTAEVQVTRNDGTRYIYGLPAQNIIKKEVTFAATENGDCVTGLVSYNPNDLNDPHKLPGDEYFNRTTTPTYAHSHLLTSILSPDYQDLSNDGPTTDDLGSYTLFTYEKKSSNYQWRIPYQENKATYNEGLKTDPEDQRGNYVYGQKEQFLLCSIATKTHIAIFEYSPRKDAHGVNGENGGLSLAPDNNSYQLDKISLYSAQEYGIPDSLPIKEVHFKYSYSLCQGVPNNQNFNNSNSPDRGKLTLDKLYFTYRNSAMGKYTSYEFNYSSFNPDYNIKGYDSWGNYKPNTSNCSNTGALPASEFPYTEQNKSIQDQYAEAWSLTSIKLPSGGTISFQYESDDYAYVQNKPTMRMFQVVGAGPSRNGAPYLNYNTASEELFGNQILNAPKTYLYVRIDDDATNTDINKYIQNLRKSPIYFRFLINMTKIGGQAGYENLGKFDYVTGYFKYQENNSPSIDSRYDGDATIFSLNYDPNNPGNEKFLSIPIELQEKEGGLIPNALTNEVHPISKAAWHFGRKYLNRHVYSNQPNGSTQDIEDMVTRLVQPNILNNLLEVFNGPNATLENKNIGRRFIKKEGKSWIRLYNPKSFKLGGGSRVKEVRITDNWQQMNPGSAQSLFQTMSYGQKYEYTLEDGSSSGVATFEPTGNKENPFVQPVYATTKHLLAPNEENYIEKPFGESFFPAPTVTYSRVKVSNLTTGIAPGPNMQINPLHKTGYVIHEFYTSKDYPTIVDQTKLKAKEDKSEFLQNLLKLFTRKHYTASQGYLIHLNDMNGRQKAQWIYAEGQAAPISGVEYRYNEYSNTNNNYPAQNKGKLNNRVNVIRPDGSIGKETIGVEVDVINDFRENATQTEIPGVNTNLATFLAGIFPGIVPTLYYDYSYAEDQFRSVTTTKIIQTFGLLKETIAYDAGAAVSTKNLAWDESTGEVLLTETVDEYNDKYYSLSYPAHWYYKGMGLASKNIGFEADFIPVGTAGFKLNNLQSGYTAAHFLYPGDELILPNNHLAWVTQVNGNTFSMIDQSGTTISNISGTLKVVRSGHRNLQSAGIMNVTLMQNPLLTPNTNTPTNQLEAGFLTAAQGDWKKWKIINAGAVDYSDNWQATCECNLDSIFGPHNPYLFNEKGVWRTKSSRTYLTGRNNIQTTTPREQGFFNSFSPMYRLTSYGNWVKDLSYWTFASEVTRFSPYGFELENRDALNRHSAAQYGYNNTFPMAVSANSKYIEIGFDGFEDYGFDGCNYRGHFNFKDVTTPSNLSNEEAHSGKYSLKVGGQNNITLTKKINCD